MPTNPTTVHPFPTYQDTDHVFCVFCKAKITGPFQASGFAPGHGAMRGQCTDAPKVCNLITYFDLAGSTRPKIIRCSEERDPMGCVHGGDNGVKACTQPAFPFTCVGGEGYVTSCTEHARELVENEIDNGLIKVRDTEPKS